MGLFDMKSFFRFLDEASDEELKQRKAQLKQFVDTASYILNTASEPENIRKTRYLLRKIEEEMLRRLE